MFYPRQAASAVESDRERIAARRAREQQISIAWRGLFQPSVIACFGLALAIVLWGYGYRLSVYQAHRDAASRTLSAKLWIDQRHSASAAVETQHAPTAVAEPSPLRSFHLICVCALVVIQPPVRRARIFKSLLPLRSPPSNSFSS